MECTVCGLPESAVDGFGYARVENGRGVDPVCYACCARRDIGDMLATGRVVLYLTRGEVTNWPGSLRFRAFHIRQSARGGGFGSQRTDADFVGPDGAIWHAVNRGDMDLARCYRKGA